MEAITKPGVGAASALTRPSSAYKLRAWGATLGLTLFVALYIGLAIWFLATAYRLTLGASGHSGDAFWGWALGLCACLLSVFMLKALVFVKHGGSQSQLEISPAQQPELFAFLHALADQLGAPRPHKVFVSAQVNASVFYDISILNLLWPSKKNLEIGLGLVNALSLGEFRAVLAHEFGHFAQRAMAVGRWVYVAQQIAAHLVGRRDKLDAFLVELSHWDVRIAWVGWVLRLIVWSIRSLVDSAFQAVLVMQRALSREMEMNADLVAVSVTGSDALIQALYRLQAADDAWSRAAGFAMAEKEKGRPPRDLFYAQSRVLSHMGRLLNDPLHGQVPPATDETPGRHRLFKPALAQPPKMWLTHPLNHDREANAKRVYVAADIDGRSAWSLFAEAQALRERVTAHWLGLEHSPQPATDPPSIAELDKQFERECYGGHYRGVYFGRSTVRHASHVDMLVQPCKLPAAAAFDLLYPERLATDMASLHTLEAELGQLRALQSGALPVPSGGIQHRGKRVRSAELDRVVKEVADDLQQVQARLQDHDRHCRGLHLAAAEGFGEGWPEYLKGLHAALHYAEHTEADLRDLQGMLRNTLNVITATHRVNKKGVERAVVSANALHDALEKVYQQATQLKLDDNLRQRMGITAWSESLGELKLPRSSPENINDWLKAVDSWVDHAAGHCAALKVQALEQLLVSERELAGHVRALTRPAPAPVATQVSADYATLLAGSERQRQTRLGWWARFQTADGWLPGLARLAAAGAIVGGVLLLGSSAGTSTVTVYNGLGLPVNVTIEGLEAVRVPPQGVVSRDLGANHQSLRVKTLDDHGHLIEQFQADVGGRYGQYVYNVASAAPLVAWTAVYGNSPARPQEMLGTPRWSHSSAQVLLAEPPRSISTKGGNGTRTVLSAMGAESPLTQVGALASEAEALQLITAHARWDELKLPYTGLWLSMAQRAPEFKALLSQRMSQAADNVLLLRLEQDSATPAEREAICQRSRARAAAEPENANLEYIALRCLPDGAAQDQAFIDGHAKHPQHGWFAYAAGWVEAARGHWLEALNSYEMARRAEPVLAEAVGLDAMRIRRLLQLDGSASAKALVAGSVQLRQMLALEGGTELQQPAYRAFAELQLGHIESAVRLARNDPKLAPQVLRLAAASEGASPTLVQEALALPAAQGLDEHTVWPSIALAARAGRDGAAYADALAKASPSARDRMRTFIDGLRQGRRPQDLERLLDGLPPEQRGQAYSAGCVLLAQNAPPAWRQHAKKLLFASERPYFN